MKTNKNKQYKNDNPACRKRTFLHYRVVTKNSALPHNVNKAHRVTTMSLILLCRVAGCAIQQRHLFAIK